MATSAIARANMAVPLSDERCRSNGNWSARASTSLLLEHLTGDRYRRDRVGPAGVEGKLRDCLHKLGLGHAVLPRQCKDATAADQDGSKSDQRAHGNEAAVTLGQSRPLPDVAEQHVVREFANFAQMSPITCWPRDCRLPIHGVSCCCAYVGASIVPTSKLRATYCDYLHRILSSSLGGVSFPVAAISGRERPAPQWIFRQAVSDSFNSS